MDDGAFLDGGVREHQGHDVSTIVPPSHVVGIGASAGGLESLEKLFRNLPADTGMAFVVLQHLSPDFKSMMLELLGRDTSMAIHRAEDGMPVEADSIYLLPPKKEMIIHDGRLRLTDKDRSQGLALPINHVLGIARSRMRKPSDCDHPLGKRFGRIEWCDRDCSAGRLCH